jgi:hypothetical protein
MQTAVSWLRVLAHLPFRAMHRAVKAGRGGPARRGPLAIGGFLRLRRVGSKGPALAGGSHQTIGVRVGLAIAAATVIVAWSMTSSALASVTVEPSGEWYEEAGNYLNARPAGHETGSDINVCYSARDGESVSEVGADELGADGTVIHLGSGPASGQGPDCRGAYLVVWSDLAEGAHTYRVWARGSLSGVVYSETWTVYIDRTPPYTPTGFEVASRDWTAGSATIEWAVDDPPLADGSPGSGVGLVEARYSVNGGPFSAWSATDADELGLTAQVGDSVTVEVRATDNVGNVSQVGSGTVTPFEEDTPPSAPTGLTANFEPVRGKAQLYWTSGVDPQPGSGAIADEWRIRQLDGTLSEWDEVDVGEPVFVNRAIGDEVELHVRTTDAAGNVSTTTVATLTVGYSTPPFWGAFTDCPDPSQLPDDENLVYSCVTDPNESAPGSSALATADVEYPSGITYPPPTDDYHWGYAKVVNLYKGRPGSNVPPVERIFEELRSSWNGVRLIIQMWSQKFGAGYPDYNPRWRINVRAADGQLRRAGPVFEAPEPEHHFDFWVARFYARDAPVHRTNSTYYFNWGRSYLLPAPLLNPSSNDGRYRPTAIRSARYYCIQSESQCKFL